MSLDLGEVRSVEYFTSVEEIHNLHIKKSKYGYYRLNIKDSELFLMDQVKSYSVLDEDEKYLFIKVNNSENNEFVLQVDKNKFPRKILKKKYSLLKGKEIKYLEWIFDFIAYSNDGKYNLTSLYDSLEDKCFVSSVKIEYNSLSKEDKNVINKYFGSKGFLKDVLLNLLAK